MKTAEPTAGVEEIFVPITRSRSMTKEAFREKVLIELDNNGLDRSWIDTLRIDRVSDGDTLVVKFSKMELSAQNLKALAEKMAPRKQIPYAAKLVLCLFVAPEKQEANLGDFEERMSKIWVPNFGPRIAHLVCMWHAVWSLGAIIRFGVMAAIVDRITRAFGW
jgi:hypothetical protein